MAIKIIPYESQHISAVKEFNQRLNSKMAGFTFPEVAVSTDFPNNANQLIYQDYFLAIEVDQKTIHGGYILKTQPCFIGGAEYSMGNYQLPLSEGIIDPKYSMVGLQLYLDAIRKQPKLYSLGMGSIDRPLPQFLQKMGWSIFSVPFYFKILNPRRVIKKLPAIRSHKKIKPFLFFLDHLKLFSILIWLLNFINSLFKSVGTSQDHSIKLDQNYGSWATDFFNHTEIQSHYQWIAKRDQTVLNQLYPEAEKKFIRIRVYDVKNNLIGWAVMLATSIEQTHKQFPGLLVGTIVDNLALPGKEALVIKACEKFLAQNYKVDLIVSNQAHKAWGIGFRRLGVLAGPSNFIAALSPAMIKAGVSDLGLVQMNRGDGDGPINL